MFTWFASLIGDVVKIVANLTDRQQAYLEWRKSPDGQLYYTREANNAFWKALAAGDTKVIDAGIKDRQDRINELRRKTGLASMLLCICMFLGCRTYTVPVRIPELVPEALTSNEVTYVLHDTDFKTPDGDTVTLDGNWHVVSSDFMKMHIRNQEDLIKVLEANDARLKENKICIGIVYAAIGLLLLTGIISWIRTR